MSVLEKQLAADRLTRNEARALFDLRLGQVKSDLAARGVGGRIADTLKTDARDALGTGVEVARERKEIIAGTIAALLLWIFRRPLVQRVTALIDEFKDR